MTRRRLLQLLAAAFAVAGCGETMDAFCRCAPDEDRRGPDGLVHRFAAEDGESMCGAWRREDTTESDGGAGRWCPVCYETA